VAEIPLLARVFTRISTSDSLHVRKQRRARTKGTVSKRYYTSLAQKLIYEKITADKGKGDPAARARLHAHLHIGLSPGEQTTNHKKQRNRAHEPKAKTDLAQNIWRKRHTNCYAHESSRASRVNPSGEETTNHKNQTNRA